ncbi:MAG: hypothetical protein ABW217_22435 [Polyangiaceae bacterium]
MTIDPPTEDDVSILAPPAEPDALDAPELDPYEDENGEFMTAARVAVGSDAKAIALKDAMTACLREHGLIGMTDDAEEDELTSDDSDIGVGFPEL